MKIFIVLLAFTCVAYGRYRRETIDNDSPFFPVDRLNPEFRSFQIGCTDDVDTCLKAVHEKAKTCVTTFKSNPKIETCLNRDDLKQGHKAFKEASFKWHTDMDLCLGGNECQDCPPTFQGDEPAYDNDGNDESVFLREKRDATDGSSESNEDSENERLKKEVKSCWKGVEKVKKECMKKALRCDTFAACYGAKEVSTANLTPRLSRWYESIRTQRASTHQIGKDNMKLLLQCIASAPVRAARDALIADPEGVVVEPDEY